MLFSARKSFNAVNLIEETLYLGTYVRSSHPL